MSEPSEKKTRAVLARFEAAQMEALKLVLKKRRRRRGEYVRIATMLAVEADLAQMRAGLPLSEMGEPTFPLAVSPVPAAPHPSKPVKTAEPQRR